MNKMITSRLQDVCIQEKGMIISGPFGSNISSKYFVDSGIPVIRGNNLNVGLQNFNDEGYVYVTETKADELKCDAIRGDLIFTAAGTIGQVAYIPENSKYERYVISNKQIRLRLNASIIDIKYAFYWFSSPWMFKILNSNNKGSTVPLLTLSEIKELCITYPENLEEQKKIANVLDTLTNKIDNNIRINSELESLAKTLYNYWFLQFEFPNEEGKPYKSSGGKMVWNKELKRDIPEGWEVKELKSMLTKMNRPHDYDKNLNTVDLSVMPSDSISINDLSDSKSFETNLFEMKQGDLLFGSIRPYLKKYGIAPCDGAVTGTVHCYQVDDNYNYNFCMATLCSESLFNFAINVSKGTKMPVVSSDDLLTYKVAYSSDIVKKFNNINFKDVICNNIMQNQELVSLRDFLLPMLMNGQVIFKDEE